MEFNGVFTALITPFGKDGAVDEDALRSLVDMQIDEGISGLVPMGTTGESPTLSHGEHIHVIEIVIDQAGGRVPIIAGTGSNCTDEAIDMTRSAMECGADASLQVAPYYNKPSQEGFYRHFSAIADAADIPQIVYNIPSRSGKNIDNETMLRLAAHPNIAGVKEASGDIPQVMDLINRKPDSFAVLSGDDNLGFPIITLGGCGIVSVASNLIPARMAELVSAALAGEYERARELHYELLPLFKVLFIDTNPIPIKYAMSLKGYSMENYRLPMCPMDEAGKEKVRKVLRDLSII